MKKRLTRVLGTIVVLLLLASSLTAFTGEINSETRLAAVFRAYIEAINLLIAEHGDSFYVELIDFDNDGLPELFIYVSQLKAYILGFTTYDELFQAEIEHGFFPPFLSIDPDPQDSAGGWYSLAMDENGRYYLVYYGFSSAGQTYIYFTIHNGHWITGLTMLSGYNFDHSERPDDWERYYMADGGFVSAEDWRSASSRILNIVSSYGFPRHEKTVHDIIAELEAKISEQWREDDAGLHGYIRVKFNGEYVDIDPAPVIVGGRVLVPVRAISEMLGAVVDWDGDTGRVFIEHTDVSIILTVDSNIAVVNGEDVGLDVPATLIDGRTMVPLRFVAEGLGAEVAFEDGVVFLDDLGNVIRSPHFIVLENQLLPPTELNADAGFLEMYERFTEAVRHRDLPALNEFLCKQIFFSFGAHEGIDGFYDHWGLRDEPEQSRLWAEFDKIIGLGGFFHSDDLFIAPYTFLNIEYRNFIVIHGNAPVYAEADAASKIIAHLSYNILEMVGTELDFELWQKTGEDFVRILTQSGEVGYIQRRYLRSPPDFRFGFSRDADGEWRMIFMVAGI